MTFLANPDFILQISHAMTFEMKYIKVPKQYYYPKVFIKSKRQIMCGSNFYVSDVIIFFLKNYSKSEHLIYERYQLANSPRFKLHT